MIILWGIDLSAIAFMWSQVVCINSSKIQVDTWPRSILKLFAKSRLLWGGLSTTYILKVPWTVPNLATQVRAQKPNPYSGSELLDGWVYGKFPSGGPLTGENVAFVYSDLRTALIGKFREKRMVRARATRITETRCESQWHPVIMTLFAIAWDVIYRAELKSL